MWNWTFGGNGSLPTRNSVRHWTLLSPFSRPSDDRWSVSDALEGALTEAKVGSPAGRQHLHEFGGRLWLKREKLAQSKLGAETGEQAGVSVRCWS